MFLSAFGVGLLSITLAPTEGELTTVADARDFNALLHFGADWRTKGRLASLSRAGKNWGDIGMEASGADLPTIASFFAPGLVWPGAERTPVLQTIKPRAVQRSFAVFAVVQLDSDVDFADETCRQQLGPELAGLQNSWASNHPGAVAADMPVTHALLSRCHWMAVGHQGAAHLVSQLEPADRDVTYRKDYPLWVMKKSFGQYLMPLVQRLSLQAFSAQAADIMSDAESIATVQDQLADLRSQLLQFSLHSRHFQLSNEDTGVRVYETCVRALGVEETWTHLRHLLEEIDAQRTADEQVQTLSAVAHIQDKVEWVEVFIIGVYAVELGHVLGESLGLTHHDAHFPWWYPGGTLLALALLTILVAAYTLQLFHARSRVFWRRTIAFLLGVVLLVSHLAIGFALKEQEAPAPESSPHQTANDVVSGESDQRESH